eukprot:gene1835-1866_t
MADLIEMPELKTDPRFVSNGERLRHRHALTAMLAETFLRHDGHDLTTRMLRAGLPAGPVLGVDEAMDASHTAHRNMVAEIGDYRALNTPIKLSRTPGGARTEPPRFGEHTGSVLAAHGFSPADIERLRDAGILQSRRRTHP